MKIITSAGTGVLIKPFEPVTTMAPRGSKDIGWHHAFIKNRARTTEGCFVDPAITSKLRGFDGHPVISRLASDYAGMNGIVLRPDVEDPVVLINEAHDLIASDSEQAGKLFHRARRALGELDYERGDIYVAAVFGEARWHSDIDLSELERAFEIVRKNAYGNEDLLRQEKMIRASAYYGAKNTAAALELLEDLTQLGAPNDIVSILAAMSKVDAHLSEGFRSTHDARERHFKKALNVLVGENELPNFIRGLMRKERFGDVDDRETMREAFVGFYIDSAVQFLGDESVGYSKYAYDVLKHVVEEYPNAKIVKTLLNDKEGPLAYFIKDGKLLDLARVPNKQRIRAKLIEALHRAQFATFMDAGKVSAVGCLLGILLEYAGSGINATYPGLLQSGALGATGTLAAMKAYLGLTSPEAKQAGETGLSRRSTKSAIKVGTGEILKLLGTYAFFGGVLPLVGVANQYEGPKFLSDYEAFKDFKKYQAFTGPDIFISHNVGHWGQFRGPGAFVSSHIDAAVWHGNDLAYRMINENPLPGLNSFWKDFSHHTVIGNSLNNGYKAWGRAIDWTFSMESLRYLERTLTHRNVPNTAKKLWIGASLLYLLAANIAPEVREDLLKGKHSKHGKYLRFAEMGVFAPGIYCLAHDLVLETTDRGEKAAFGIPLLGAFSQVRQHWQNGGRLSNINTPKLMTSLFTQILYAGPGKAMQATNAKHTAWDIYQNSMGIQFWLQPIALPHAYFTGWNLGELMKIKAAQSWRDEYIGNGGRIVMEWESVEGTAWNVMVKQVGLKSWIGSWRKEQTGTTSQRNRFRDLMRPRDDSDVIPISKISAHDQAFDVRDRLLELRRYARGLKERAHREGGDWIYYRAVRMAKPEDRLRMMTCPYEMRECDDVTFPRHLGLRHFTRLHGMLTSSSIPESAIDQYLDDFDAMLFDADAKRADYRFNFLVVTWAARNGFHKGRIERYFQERPRLIERLKEEKIGRVWGPTFTWFLKNLKWQQQGAEKMEADMMQATTSAPFWDFITGNTTVERTPYFSMMVMSLMRKDPPMPLNVLEKAYRDLYSVLLEDDVKKKMSRRELDQFLTDMREILFRKDEHRRYLRRNLLVTLWAAGQVGPHKDEIQGFFERDRDFFRTWYGVDPTSTPELNDPPAVAYSRAAKKWFKANMQGSDIQADGLHQDRSSLLGRLWRRTVKARPEEVETTENA